MKNKKAGETNLFRKKVMTQKITFVTKVKSKSVHLLSDKKAGERVLSIYLFIIYIIVGIGIVSGVIIFYGSGLDVRELEAGILTDSVIDCLVDEGELDGEVLNRGKEFDLMSRCKFDFRDNTEKYGGEERYGVKFEVSEFDSEILKNEISAGRTDFLEFCGSEGDKIPKCDLKEVYVLNNKNKYLLRVQSAVGKV